MLVLGVFLILFAVSVFGWMVIPPTVLGVFAFIAGILIIAGWAAPDMRFINRM